MKRRKKLSTKEQAWRQRQRDPYGHMWQRGYFDAMFNVGMARYLKKQADRKRTKQRKLDMPVKITVEGDVANIEPEG